jgi:prepilin peptidase CpaA
VTGVDGSMAATVAQVLLALCLILAAAEDAWRYRISNSLSASIVALFVVVAALRGFRIDWLDHLAGAGLVFAVGVPMFARGWLGGGDVKLLTAVALWCGLGDLPLLLVLMSLVGGVLVIGLMALRRALPAMNEAAPRHGLLRRNGPIPYGIAIAFAALLVLGRAPAAALPL